MQPRAILLLLLAAGTPAQAQCPGEWTPMFVGLHGKVNAIASWDPDGSGPQAERIAVAGDFKFAGGRPASNVAIWDGESWDTLQNGCNGEVWQAYAFQGSLYIEGSFTHAGGVQTGSIAKWDGHGWDAVASLPPAPRLLGVHHGRLVIGSRTSSLVYFWDGQQYTFENCICVGPQAIGEYGAGYVAGSIPGWAVCVNAFGATAGSVTATGLSAPQFGDIRRFVTYNNALYVAGDCYPQVARWDGATWQDAGAGGPSVTDLAVVNGDLFVSGRLWNGAMVARWTGANWETLAPIVPSSFLPNVYALGSFQGRLVAAGQFGRVAGVSANSLATWDGAAWDAIDTGVDIASGGTVLAILSNDDDLYVAGRFNSAGGVKCNGIARWDGAEWHALGTGTNQELEIVRTLAISDGDLVAAGNFSGMDGQPAPNVARWDGQAWHAMAGGLPGNTNMTGVRALHVHQGALYAAGRFEQVAAGVARWTGTSWTQVGSGVPWEPFALTTYNGELHVGGSFPNGTPVYRFDGNVWQPVASGNGSAYTLQPLGSDLFLILGYTPAFIRRWNGTSLTSLSPPLGSSRMSALGAYGGQLIASGTFETAGNVPAMHLASWDGSNWHPLGLGIDSSSGDPYSGIAEAIGVHAGRLVVGGDFDIAGGERAQSLAFWYPGEPACYPNCDCSAATPILNASDFVCFLERFATGDAYANCDQSTTAPVLNVADFTCFLRRFAGGCR